MKFLGLADGEQDSILIIANVNQAGTYEITPYAGTVKLDTPIQIQVTNNPTVKTIALDSNIADKELKVNEEVVRKLVFTNVNNEEIKVTADRITVDSNDIIVKLYDKDNNELEMGVSTVEVEKIVFSTNIKTDKYSTVTLKVSNGNVTKQEILNIAIGSEATISILDVQSTVKLYDTTPVESSELDNVVVEDGVIYSLIKIELQDNYQRAISILKSDYLGANLQSENNKLSVADSISKQELEDGDLYARPYIGTKAYKEDKTEAVNPDDEIVYIGIALPDGITLDSLNGIDLIFTYGGIAPANVRVTI